MNQQSNMAPETYLVGSSLWGVALAALLMLDDLAKSSGCRLDPDRHQAFMDRHAVLLMAHIYTYIGEEAQRKTLEAPTTEAQLRRQSARLLSIALWRHHHCTAEHGWQLLLFSAAQ